MLLLHYSAIVGLGREVKVPYVRYVGTSFSAVSLRRTGTPLSISYPSSHQLSQLLEYGVA